ncbi:MAG: DUF4058 family protein [Fimbriiglobus sp.]
MPSPFPGMDPYLEDLGFWQGFHTSMQSAMRAQLTPQLPRGFYADIEQHVWFREDGPREGPTIARPDLYVLEGPNDPKAKGRAARGPTAVAEPTARLTLPNVVREVGRHAIRIRDRRDRRVVTAIELLSPSNKDPGDERDRYLLKRSEFLANETSLVELDLLRRGQRLPFAALPDGDYYIYVTDAARYTEVAVWAFTVRDPIPPVPVPLPHPHRPVLLDLRPCLDRVYQEANYGPQIEYTAPPVPRLRPADATWAADVLKKHARKRK